MSQDQAYRPPSDPSVGLGKDESDGESGVMLAPRISDTLKKVTESIAQATEMRTRCKAVVCHLCGLKDHDAEPHTYELPCDHPWVLARTGTKLLEVRESSNGKRKFYAMDGQGNKVSQAWANLVGGQCGCI